MGKLLDFLKRPLVLVAASAFLAALLLQSVWWWHFSVIDSGMWANQGPYLMEGDPRVFDMLAAYAHPGGTIIEGVLLIEKITGSSDLALRVFLSLFNALVIAAVAVCVFILRRDWWWAVSAVIVLSLHKLYFDATPTTAVAAPLVVLLVMLTLLLYEGKVKVNGYSLAVWGAVSGLVVATRADIGGLATVVFFGLLCTVLRVRELALIVLVALLFFIIADPFMWFMPIQHVFDLVHKITYHYSSGNIVSPPPAYTALLDLTLLSLISVTSLAVLMWKRVYVLPQAFVVALAVFTVSLLFVLFTSKFQASRYFMPFVLVWEVFLPLCLFSVVDQLLKLRCLDGVWARRVARTLVVGGVFLVHFVTLSVWFGAGDSVYPFLFS